ncbi:TetR/AcrR family transcriptional regulator [Beijerinckia sp. L45]|uniref:TetR/AcrR family transcriptional regulator n=1 Tax=Beijerinckia sp. L45 TaxID=1641855 RepID=UPI00131CD5EF|nr:TetR/AcrR family transcriptional regulator [Beijerinckia sp. L45]
MTDRPNRQTRKRLATRQSISDAATRLFLERGFEGVTIDEIAAAADVGRMTVFNHFPRKEDMFFDQDQEARDVVLDAIRSRDPEMAPVEKLRLLAHRLIAEDRSYIRFFDESRRFVETVAASEALKARARAIRDEVVRSMTEALATSFGRPASDPDAYLTASLLMATWTVAFIQAHDVYRSRSDPEPAKAAFLAIIDRGATGIKAAIAGTTYA